MLGGDLGRASHVYSTALSARGAIVTATEIFDWLKREQLVKKPIRYAIEISVDVPIEIMNELVRSNPFIYESNGIRVFDVKSSSGGIVLTRIIYVFVLP
jgi:hypothetical protein